MSRIIKIKIKGHKAEKFLFENKKELEYALKGVIKKRYYTKEKNRFEFLIQSIWNLGQKNCLPWEEVQSSMLPGITFMPNKKPKPMVLQSLRAN